MPSLIDRRIHESSYAFNRVELVLVKGPVGKIDTVVFFQKYYDRYDIQ